ncbi:MAG: ImmA/IrrE family metallo-endopeptidase [Solibacillus sp.]
MASCLTHLEEYVKNLYIKIGITKPHQLDFQKISDALGIQVFYWPDASQALFTGSKGFILLNELLSPQLQWQDYCHELGHVLLHVGNQWQMQESFRAYQEEKANLFMQHACIPTFMLNELNLYDCGPFQVYEVQQLFNVDYSFAHKRLQQYINNKRIMPNWNFNLSEAPIY